MAGKTGNQKIIEQFLADGMNVMFGNPGTVEQGFLDALAEYPDMKYILTLQESIAVLIADGYARSTQKPALVQLHSSPGIGNAVGALYQAKRGHSPLVVIGGDAGVKYMNMDAQMANDLVAMMAPVTKYSTLVTEPKNLLRTIRRAIKIAATPPMGPVYICLPMDILDEKCEDEIIPTFIPSTRVTPSDNIIEETVKVLSSSTKPVIFIGDGIAYSGATSEVARIAELVGAEIYAVDFGDFVIDTTHPCYQGTTGHMFGSFSHQFTGKGDVNLILGTYMLPEVFPDLDDIYAKDSKVIHFDLNAYEIAKNHRVDIGAVSDPKLTLTALIARLEETMTSIQRSEAIKRFGLLKQLKEKKDKAAIDADKAQKENGGLQMSRFAEILAQKIPENAVLFDEALTSSPAVTRYLPPKKPGEYFVTRGGSLGIGIPGAIGVKLHHPENTVIGFTGDGGSMYTIQALWSAVRHNIGAKFVVCNNSSYRLLQLNIDHYWKERYIKKQSFPLCFDLSYPALHFDQIALSMGVDAVRVDSEAKILPALERMFANDKPFLIDLVLEGNVNSEQVSKVCGH